MNLGIALGYSWNMMGICGDRGFNQPKSAILMEIYWEPQQALHSSSHVPVKHTGTFFWE